MRAVNLLPRDSESSRSENSRAPLLIAGGGIVMVTVATVVLALSTAATIDEKRDELAATEAAIAAVPTQGRSAPTSAVIVQERTDRTVALAAALTSRVPFDRLLRDLSYVLPQDAWLTGMTAAAPVGASAAPGAPARVVRVSRRHDPGRHVHAGVRRARSRSAVDAAVARAGALDRKLARRCRPDDAAPKADKGKSKRKQKAVVTFTISAALRAGECIVNGTACRTLAAGARCSRRRRSARVRTCRLPPRRLAPDDSEAATLSADVAAADVRLAELQAGAIRPRTQGTPVADVFRLAKAMPSSGDQAGLMLELDRLARASGVTLSSVTQQGLAVDAGGATSIPVVVTVSGSYRQIADVSQADATARRGPAR